MNGDREMLAEDFRAIPDLLFNMALLVCDTRMIAGPLVFDCAPKNVPFGLPVNGKRVRF